MLKINFTKVMPVFLVLLFGLSLISNANAQAQKRPKNGTGGLVNLDFQDADIKDLVKSISEITGKNFILDDRVRGKITIISPTPVTTKEAYEAFLSALEIKNYTVVPGSGRTLKIVPLREAKNSAITTISDMETPYGDTFITRLIPIRFISASEIANSLKSLVSPNGTISSYSPTNTLMVTDSASNIRRLMKIIGKLDKEGSIEGVEVIPLKYASAQEMSQKLLTLFPQQKDGSLLARALSARRGEQEPAQAQSISRIIPDDRTNSLIVVANRQGLERLLDIVKRLDVEVKSQEGKGRIHVHYLEHADAAELAATLSSLSGGGGGRSASPKFSRGSSGISGGAPAPTSQGAVSLDIFEGDIKIAPDIATNSLVITASGQDYDSLKSVISKLDIARPQVFVEALIMEVSMNKALDAGLATNSGTQVGSSNNPTSLFGATQFGDLSSLFLPSNPTALTGLAFGLRSKEISIPTGNGNSISIPIYGAIFRALQTNGTFNIISTPNILTTDNKEAEIVVGKVVPILTAQQQATTGASSIINQISREKVATTLKVTPQINESNFVTLDIYQEISEVESQSPTLGPTTSTRSAKTTVVVQDGQTVVIGGLIKDKVTNSVSKVPILGDIPLIGLLFRTTHADSDKINLMIFITPHIIHQPMDLQNVTVKQNEKRRLFNKQNKIEEHPGVKGYGLDKSVDFNSVRPNKKVNTEIQEAPAPSRNETQSPVNETFPKTSPEIKSDNDNPNDEGREIAPPDSGTEGRSSRAKSQGDFTQVNMRPSNKARTKPNDESFFKEESTATELDDSDYISEDLMMNNKDKKPAGKTGNQKKGETNPFMEIAPPSSDQ